MDPSAVVESEGSEQVETFDVAVNTIGSSSSDDQHVPPVGDRLGTIGKEVVNDGENVPGGVESSEVNQTDDDKEMGKTQGDETGNDDDGDVYSYARHGYTSETCKIELKNLPHFVRYSCVKKFIEKQCNVKAHKVKIIDKHPKFAYVSFSCDDDRDKAISVLNGLKWRNKVLIAKRAAPVKDPLLLKRQHDGQTDDPLLKKQKSDGLSDLSDLELGKMINDKVAPLWMVPYDKQLEKKEDKYRQFLIQLQKEIHGIKEVQATSDLELHLRLAGKDYGGLICPLEAIRPSPVLTGYRNKCEFSIGEGKVIGFRLGLYKEGSITVIRPPENCPIVSSKMQEIITVCQKLLLDTELDAFNNINGTGYWRQLTVRCTELGSMIILALHPQDLGPDELEKLKIKIIQFFEIEAENIPINSIFFHPFKSRDKLLHDQTELEHLHGDSFIVESMRNGELKLKISPFAFFQTNTRAAEVCYSSIVQLACLKPNSIVLDICCGTGPIGLYVASHVKYVVGIELSKDAVSDARYNAEINGIKNIKFYEGKAESLIDLVIQEIIQAHGKDIELVAIIDPPRAGLSE